MSDKNALSYWFPLIEAAGLPVPKTKIVQITDSARQMIWDAFDGKSSGSLDDPFFVQLQEAARELGLPCFLRTDHTSAKHYWEKSCFVGAPEDIPAHVMKIAEFSECCDLMGLPWNAWAVREMLPTTPHGVCPRYGHMPVCREFRFFVDEGKVRCFHPYWPWMALEKGDWDRSADEDYALLCAINHEAELCSLAERAGRAVGGSWSIDILETRKGWYVTDMAEAHRSFHWEECPHRDDLAH